MTSPFDDYDIKKVGDDGFSISIDVQNYIDDAVKKLHNAVRDQVESNLQFHLRVAFEGATAGYFDDVAEERWREFLRLLSIQAGEAVKIIEERNDG